MSLLQKIKSALAGLKGKGKVEEGPLPDPIVDDVYEPVAEEAPEPVIEEAPVSEPAVEESPEPTIEDTPEPVIEEAPVSEPIIEEATEPVIDEDIEPEPVTQEPVAEKTESDVSEKGKEAKKVPAAKKGKGAKSKKGGKKAAKGYGDSPLGKSLNFAMVKLDEKKDGLSEAEYALYRTKIEAFADRVGKDEDEALVSVSQLIGAITRA